jgi:hypothetical protein
MCKYEDKFELMLKNFKEHTIDIDSLENNYKKTILIGIQETLTNEKQIAATKALYIHYAAVRLFTPILYNMYMKTK